MIVMSVILEPCFHAVTKPSVLVKVKPFLWELLILPFLFVAFRSNSIFVVAFRSHSIFVQQLVRQAFCSFDL